MLREQSPGILYHWHGEDPLVMIVSQLAHLLNGNHGRFPGQLYLEVLCDGRDEETRQGVGGLAQHVADQGLGDVVADWEAEGGLCGDVQGVGFAPGGSWGCGGLETKGFSTYKEKEKEFLFVVRNYHYGADT